MVNQKEHAGLPFLRELIDTSYAKTIKSFADNPSIIVRIKPFDPLFTTEDLVNRYSEGRKLLTELNDDFEISVPDMDFVIGSRNGYKCGITITQRVTGPNLSELDVSAEKTRVLEDMDNFYAKFVTYYQEKYNHRGNFLSDLRNEQFVYGTTTTDQEKKVYLVDLDPIYFPLNHENMDSIQGNVFLSRIQRLHLDIKEMEKKVGVRFENARELFFRFIQRIPSSRYCTFVERILADFEEEEVAV